MSLKLAVFGNATLDAILSGTAKPQGNALSIESEEGAHVSFPVEDGPIETGGKYRVNRDIGAMIMPLWHRFQPGGGGFNSAIAMRNLPDADAQIDITYIDVSNTHPLIAKYLDHHDIDSLFFQHRDIPINAILGHGHDRIVLKGPALTRFEPEQGDKQRLQRNLKGAKSLLLSSLKDVGYAEMALREAERIGIPVYAVITNSLDRNYTFDKMLGRVRGIFSVDEVPYLMGAGHSLSQDDKYALSYEFLRKVRKDYNPSMMQFVTLGKDGVLVSKKHSITHLELKHDEKERVGHALSQDLTRKNGIGDVFAAAIPVYDGLSEQKIDPITLGYKASKAAIRKLGYNGHLTQESFERRQTPLVFR